MRILYISVLPGIRSGGPRYSIPRQISSQAKFDEVYWVNLNANEAEACGVECNNFDGKNRFLLELLPSPFNKPDLVVFEGVYYPKYCAIANMLRRKSIPYIIVPRSSLTGFAQKIKRVKKNLGNIILFNRFIGNAAAIQYLTESEREASGIAWNKRSIVIPNGIDNKERTKVWNGKESLKGIFIGRMNMFHKGLDFLMDSCIRLKDELIERGCTIDLYGPDRDGAKAIMARQIEKNGLDGIVSIKDEIYGMEKERVLLESDFFILSSRFEGHPMGLLEALSYGIPCLVTEGSNMAGEISETDSGWTAKTNAESLAEALAILINDRDGFKEKGNNALTLSKKFDWMAIAERAHEIYCQIVDRG